MPRTKRKPSPAKITRPRGFYLKRNVWYARIYKPHPITHVWGMHPESTGHTEGELEQAIAYVERRNQQLKAPALLHRSDDPSKVTMNELFDDLLAAQRHEPTRQDYEWSLKANLRPYFGQMLAVQLTVEHCRSYRAFRRTQKRNEKPISHVTINRELSKVSRAFKLAIQVGKLQNMPPGGCDYWKKPETQNTRRVRLPDRYYEFFRDKIHSALRCAFVLAYNIGRRKADILSIKWDQIHFDEKCIYFEVTKTDPVKCPFIGDMESTLLEQKQLRDQHAPNQGFVSFWFDTRSDKDGQPVKRFDAYWNHAVDALKVKMTANGEQPIELHFHDLRRSAHYQMRKGGIDSGTRRAIMGHKTDSMDRRYTMIDDEAIDDARAKMEAYHRAKGLPNQTDELRALRAQVTALKKALSGKKAVRARRRA